MKQVLLTLVLLFSCGCGNLKEPLTFAGSSSDPIAAGFAGVSSILQRNCASCHEFASYSESALLASGYVVAGAPEESLLFSRLKGAGVGGNEAMPQGGQLSPEHIAAIRDWIDSLAQPTPPPDGGPAGPPAADRTRAALDVLRARCFSCHNVARTGASSDYSGTQVPVFANFTTDNQFATSGLVNPGSPAQSWLYRALKAYGDINTMPNGAAALSSADQTSLREWIAKMGLP